MRRQFIAVAIFLTAASAASADTLGVFVSDPGYAEAHTTTSGDGVAVNHSYAEWSGGIGLAWDHTFNQRWSSEASIMFDRRHTLGTRFEFGVPVTRRQNIDTYPVDVVAKYRFTNESRWTPYVSGGLHYVHAPSNEFAIPVLMAVPGADGTIAPITVQHLGDRASLQLGVGTTFRITPSLGLQFDLKRQLRQDGAFYDPLTRGSFGLNWKF
jgi:outer membrane protein W